MYTIEQIKNKVAPIAKEYEIDKVYLFGSYARGDATPESDVDLLIKGLQWKKTWRFFGLYSDLEDALGNIDLIEAEALNAKPHDNDRGLKIFKHNLIKERVLIYGE